MAPILYPVKAESVVLDLGQTAFAHELIRTLIEANADAFVITK